MIENFEAITFELTEDEKKAIPYLVSGFKQRTADNPIKAPEIIAGMVKVIPNFSEPRLRKCVNYIRTNAILPLIATSRGYYCSNDTEVIKSQINSLEQRANSIARCAEGLKIFLI